MNAMYAFWHAMIVHLWQTTLILVIILILERMLKGAPSRVNHTLWSVGLAKIFLPFSIFGGMSELLFRAVMGGRAGAGESAGSTLQPVVAVLYPLNDTAAPEAGSALSYVAVAATAVWAAFVFFFIARIVIDVARARRHGGRPLGSADSDVSSRLAGQLAAAEIPSDRVLLSAELIMPTVTGLIRPRIVIPEHVAAKLQEEELRAILLHEETHRLRRDPLRTAVQRLGQALFFFYPLIYPVLRRLRSTAEFACDEKVVYSGVPGLAYSRALVRTLEFGLALPAFATAAVAESSLLRRRLKRLSTLTPRRYAMRLQYRILIVAAVLLVAAATLYPLPMKATPEGKKPTPEQKKDAAKEEVKEITAKVEVVTKVAPKYPEEARKMGATSRVYLRIKIVDTGEVITATVDSQTVKLAQGKVADKDMLKKLRALFEKSAIDAGKRWTFKVDSTGGKADTVDVTVPVEFKLQ
jgi:beta-lactamase regulating signal transducer with metallopeptidase domain